MQTRTGFPRLTCAALVFGCSTLVSALVSGLARAAGGAATDAYEGIDDDKAVDVHVLADVYLQHRLGRPVSGALRFRAFDPQTEALSLSFFRLTLAHAPESTDTGPSFGFRVDAGVGDTPNGYLRSDPAAALHPASSRALSYVEQAFATVRLSVGQGVAVDVGKFGTPVGLEENESLLNWSYSRSFLYTLAEPTFHSGVRATYPLAETLAITLFWLNGWNTNVFAGSGMRSFAGAVTWSPDTSVQLVLAYAGGLERAPTAPADPTTTFRSLLDGYATVALTRRLSFALTFDVGHDARGVGASFWGLAGYARYELLPWLAGTLRAEHFADPDGFMTGESQRMSSATATMEGRSKVFDATVIARLEYRRDASDMRVFEGSLPYRDTLTLGLIAAF